MRPAIKLRYACTLLDRSSKRLSISPRTAYDAAVRAGELQQDVHQQTAIDELERLHDELQVWRPPPPPPPPPPPKASKWNGPSIDAYGEPIGGGTFYTGQKTELLEDNSSGLWPWLRSLAGGSAGDEGGEGKEPGLSVESTTPRGVYMHGGTGCGKSMMMDRFFWPSLVAPQGASASWVRRVHLHEFLIEMHQRAHKLREETPTMGDPVPYLAYELACETQVLLLDEVAVADVADALMLRKLFRRLFNFNLVIVVTSNRAPEELYHNGLQRDSFLQFIDDVEQRCYVHKLLSTVDYRALATAASGTARLSPEGLGAYLHPLDASTAARVASLWALLTEGVPTGPHELQLSGRTLEVPAASEARRTARFTFEELCAQPLGAEDYLAVARAYSTVFVEGVPQLTLSESTELRRLITMVDAFYDQQVMLVVSAAVPKEELFVAVGVDAHTDRFADVIGTSLVQESGDENFAFARTLSRLQEMGSQAYVARSNRWMQDCSMAEDSEV